jgi:hypothetical protein
MAAVYHPGMIKTYDRSGDDTCSDLDDEAPIQPRIYQFCQASK